MTTKLKSRIDNTKKFEETLNPGYALETLINGNISECISYLKTLRECGGTTGELCIHEELVNIKEQCPEKYNYIKNKVYSPF